MYRGRTIVAAVHTHVPVAVDPAVQFLGDVYLVNGLTAVRIRHRNAAKTVC